MHTLTNYKTKQSLKQAVANGETVKLHSNLLPIATQHLTGTVFIEGHPPCTWHARVRVVNGIVVKVR